MASSSWEEKLTCKWTDEGQLDIMGFPDDMPICLQYYLCSIKSEKWPRALHLIRKGEGHCFVSGTGISFPPDYESSSSSDEDGPKRGPLPEDEVELCAGRFPKNRVKRLLFHRIVKKCLSERSNKTHGPLDGEKQFLAYLDKEERAEPTELAETGSPGPMEIPSSDSFLKGQTAFQVTQSEHEEMKTSEVQSMKPVAVVHAKVHTEVHVDVPAADTTIGRGCGTREESNPLAETKMCTAPTSHDDIRDLISNNYDLLKDNINVDNFFRHMIHKHVVEPSDMDEILGRYILGSERTEALLDMISRRRSCTPALFLHILRIEHPYVVDKLSTEVSSPKYIISRQKTDEGPFYKMSHSPRGTALIVMDTDSTHEMKEESELLADAFKSLNFLPKIVKDINSSDTFQSLNTDCSIVYVLSESSSPHRSIEHILHYSTSGRNVNRKPTLIFIHIFEQPPHRMMMHHYRVMRELDEIGHNDCYFSISNSPNYSRALAKTLMEYGKSDEFVSIMAKVYSVCDNFYCQNGLQKRLHFSP